MVIVSVKGFFCERRPSYMSCAEVKVFSVGNLCIRVTCLGKWWCRYCHCCCCCWCCWPDSKKMFLFVVRLLRSLVADTEDEEKNSLILFCFQKMNDACICTCALTTTYLFSISQYNTIVNVDCLSTRCLLRISRLMCV